MTEEEVVPRYPILGIALEGGGYAPLFLNAVNGTPAQARDANIRYTLAQRYRSFNEAFGNDLPAPDNGKTISVVGSGPSLAATLDELTGDVLAVNAAHDFLIARGITPTFAVVWDPDEVIADMIHPIEGVHYLIASRCHPRVIDKFLAFDTTIWHAMGDENLHEILEESGRMEPWLGGGSGGVTRMMFLAFDMGYREIHLFGVDSSFDDVAVTHVLPNPAPQKLIRVRCLKRDFLTTPQLGAQAEDWKLLAPIMRDAGARLTVHGIGLVPYVAKSMGFTVTNSQSLEDT